VILVFEQIKGSVSLDLFKMFLDSRKLIIVEFINGLTKHGNKQIVRFSFRCLTFKKVEFLPYTRLFHVYLIFIVSIEVVVRSIGSFTIRTKHTQIKKRILTKRIFFILLWNHWTNIQFITKRSQSSVFHLLKESV